MPMGSAYTLALPSLEGIRYCRCMKEDIVEKLRKHLSAPVDDECRVVYLLVQIRKVLEDNTPINDRLPYRCIATGRFMWTWTVGRPTKEFLQAVDSYVRNNVTGFDSDESFQFLSENRLLDDFILLDTFRKQLGDFLGSCDLPTQLTDDDTAWLAFVEAYAGVIEDGTLSATRQALVAVDKVTFRKDTDRFCENHRLTIMSWDIELKNGRNTHGKDRGQARRLYYYLWHYSPSPPAAPALRFFQLLAGFPAALRRLP